MILYSIIVPVYNTGKFLDRCIKSVLNQTYKNWELILVDDGSTDESTVELCDYYGHLDKRIKVFHKNNEGLLLTRRFGMKQATGDFICSLDSDDYLNIKMLSKIDSVIEKHDCDLVLFRYKRVGTRLNRKSDKVFRNGTIFTQENNLALKRALCSGSSLNNMCLKVVKREKACIELDFSDYSTVKYGEDKIQSIPIIFSCEKVVYVTDVLYYYVNNPNSITQSSRAKKQYWLQYENVKTINKMLLQYLEKYNREDSELFQMLVAELFSVYMSIARQHKPERNLQNDEYIKFLEALEKDQYLKEFPSEMNRNMLSRENQKAWDYYDKGKLKQYILKK